MLGRKPLTFVHAVRTAGAAIASFPFARLFHLPEADWAPISTMIVMQSTLDASLSISLHRFDGAMLFLIGFPCAASQIERAPYRFAGITLVIVVFVPARHHAAIIAIHRFCKVSLGGAGAVARRSLAGTAADAALIP